MELRHLRYFLAAADAQHFGRASEKLHVTRPAVSRIIADLEIELDLLLFERKNHRVTLTAAGRKLFVDVKAVMSSLTEAVLAAKKIGDGKSGNLNVGYGTLTLHNDLFRASIQEFKRSNPDVSLGLVELPTYEQGKALADGRIHVGFMHFGEMLPAAKSRRQLAILPSQDASVLDWFTIESGNLGVIMEKGHRLASRKHLSALDLADEGFIVVPNSSASPGYGTLYALCHQAGFEPRIAQEVDSIGSLLNLVSVDMGIGLCIAGKHFVYPNRLRIVPLRGVAYSASFVVAWMKGRHEPLVQSLLDAVKNAQGNG